MSRSTGEQHNSITQQGRNQLQQLHCTVVWVSGQDPDHTKEELHRGSKESRGWQSPRNCSYPQQIILKISSVNELIELSKIQFLSHQSKIASKVEIVVADDFDGSNMDYPSTNTERQRSITFEDCRNIRRLGYVSLNSNEQSQYQARELKSINITPQRAMFVKLILHDCWKNDLNPYNQVGIISIQLLGTHGALKPQSTVENSISAATAAVSIRSLHHNNYENTPVRVRNRAIPPPTLKLHPDIQDRIDALEVKKRDRAKMEDFEMASILKDLLNEVQSNFATALQLEFKMRKAAEEEEYAQASEYKSQRDSARKSAMDILEKAESSLQNSAAITQETVSQPFVVPCQTEHQTVDSIQSAVQRRPPSISSAVQHKLGSLSPKATGAILSNKPSTPDPNDSRELYQETTYNGSKDIPTHLEESPISTRMGMEAPELELLESGEHPLEGVPGFQDLPIPEEIIDTRISSEVLMRIEAVLGLYRTKCFFSRNWSLRDAALTKLSLILYTNDIEGSAPTLCLILERAVNDCVVQVFLTGLLLLDECLAEFEKLKMPQKSVIPMVEKVAIALVGKLSDNKPKVSDGAASALLSLASSQCIGPTYIGNLALKAMRPQDSKAGRAVCARLKFLEKLIEEYGDEAVRTERVVHFIKSSANGFSHKDADVRTATKDLITAMYKLIGEDVLFMLDGLSAKQLQEYKASFVATRQNSPFKESNGNSSYPTSSSHSPLVTVQSNEGVTPGKLQGRGRGRRRNVIAASVDHQVQENKAMNSIANITHNRSLQHNGQFDDVHQSAHDDGECLKEGRDESYDSP